MLAQPPDVGFVASQTSAVYTTLLSGSDTDGLTVLNVAYRVRLSVFQCDEADDEVSESSLGECLVLGRDVFKQSGVVKTNLVVSLFEGYTEHLFALDGLRRIVRGYFDEIVCCFMN